MKAIILSGGKGTRLRPFTYTRAKQLLPVANKPILWYGIESIAAAGITEIGIIISPETGVEVQAKTGNGDRFGVQITYIVQVQPAGLAQAVQAAQPFLGNAPFVMYLGDNLIEDDLRLFVEHFKRKRLDVLTVLGVAPDPSAFGVATVDPQGRVLRLVEKPSVPASNLVLVGVYLFSAKIHQAIAVIQPSVRGELEITDAIQVLIERHQAVEALHLQGWWLDIGKKDDLLAANRMMLDTHLQSVVLGDVDSQSRVIGCVQIGEGTTLINCTVQGPVAIGRNCHLENCWVGPYSSIADAVMLRDVTVEQSVILEGAIVTGTHQRIVDSVIGQRAQVKSTSAPKALRLLVGDDSQIELE